MSDNFIQNMTVAALTALMGKPEMARDAEFAHALYLRFVQYYYHKITLDEFVEWLNGFDMDTEIFAEIAVDFGARNDD
jgi:hypothetical protein